MNETCCITIEADLGSSVWIIVIMYVTIVRYYGLQLWFPEYFKRLREDVCDASGSCTNATDLHYYQDTLYTAIASLPGNVAGALLINVIGGKIQLGTLVSCVTTDSCLLSISLVILRYRCVIESI